jgi:hypothetical protein
MQVVVVAEFQMDIQLLQEEWVAVALVVVLQRLWQVR